MVGEVKSGCRARKRVTFQHNANTDARHKPQAWH